MIKKTLYFGNAAYLSLRNEQLVIKLPEVEKNNSLSEVIKKESVRTIPIEDIGVVVLDSQEITITQGVMAALLENRVAVITCSKNKMPIGLNLPLVGNNEYSERFLAQIQSSLPLRKQLWQQTIVAKITNQATLLKRSTGCDAKNLLRMADNVKSGDPDNYEGQAAAFYWKNIFPDNPKFVRSREGEFPNALLNYGYAILRAVVARALVSSGLLPIYGIHHHNKYNSYCLADDIMEPYRPFVDMLVIETIKNNPLEDKLTLSMKRDLLMLPALDVKIGNKKMPLMTAMSQTTASLAKCFLGEIRKVSYPEFM